MPKKSHTSVGMSDQPQDDLENLKTQLATAVSQGTSREGLVSALQLVLEQLQQAVQTGVPAAEQQMLEQKFDDEQTPGSAAADTQRQLAGAGKASTPTPLLKLKEQAGKDVPLGSIQTLRV